MQAQLTHLYCSMAVASKYHPLNIERGLCVKISYWPFQRLSLAHHLSVFLLSFLILRTVVAPVGCTKAHWCCIGPLGFVRRRELD